MKTCQTGYHTIQMCDVLFNKIILFKFHEHVVSSRKLKCHQKLFPFSLKYVITVNRTSILVAIYLEMLTIITGTEGNGQTPHRNNRKFKMFDKQSHMVLERFTPLGQRGQHEI